jgi:hypothetical protein
MTPYEDVQHAKGGDGGGFVANAWADVEIRANIPVTVLLGLENGTGVRRGEPSLVISRERESSIVQALTEEHRRLDTVPNRISDLVISLERRPNPALAGYLFAYLEFSSTRPLDYDRDSTLLLQMAGNPSVPNSRWMELVDSAIVRYAGASLPTRAAFVQRLAELGQQPDVQAAMASYHGLGKIAGVDPSVKGLLSSNALEGLRNAYRAMVKKGTIRRDAALESGFAIDYR